MGAKVRGKQGATNKEGYVDSSKNEIADGQHEATAVEIYDGVIANNTTLSGVDEKIVEESIFGIDHKSMSAINTIMAEESTNVNCLKAKEDNVFWNSSPYADEMYYFKSDEDMKVLEREYDWVMRKKDTWNAVFATMTIVLQVVEIEYAYDPVEFKYQVGGKAITIMKGVQSFFTLILLYMVYDAYSYQIMGIKKKWYVSLYKGKRPGALPRGIWGSYLRNTFLFEMFIILIHVPPGLDFRYWEIPEGKINVNIGMKKPFLCDNFGVFMVLRLYLWIRVIRDNTTIYQRRRLVYEGGYKDRGGPEIDFKIACKVHYLKKEALSVFTLLAFGAVILTYMTWVSERDYQPSIFTLKASFWFTMFQSLLCGFNGMEALTTFGSYVSLMVVFFGITVLSLAIAVVFNSISLSANESWALDWLRDYALKEKELNAATDYLAYWWRYLAVRGSGDTELPPDEKRKLQAEYYSKSVTMFTKMSKTTNTIAGYAILGDDTAQETAMVNAQLVTNLKKNLLGKGEGGAARSTVSEIVNLEGRVASVEATQSRILRLLNEL